MSDELIVFIIAMLPVIELRGAIPIGVGLGLSPMRAFILALMGNLLVIPILLWLLEPVVALLEKNRHLSRIIHKIRYRSSLRYQRAQEKYKSFALFAFVAIPMVGTGAWAGSLVARLFKVSFLKANVAISAGVICAGIAIGLLSNIITLF